MARSRRAFLALGLLAAAGVGSWRYGPEILERLPLPPLPPGPSPVSASRQLVLVVSDGWGDIDAVMAAFEKQGAGWSKAIGPVPATVGSTGMGWAPGLHAPQRGRHAREGDNRAPAGAFRLGPAFGHLAKGPGRASWLPLTESLQCVDDTRSRFYARIVDGGRIPYPDWHSAERMVEYRDGVVISLADPPIDSCLFIHDWGGPHNGTQGCTGAPPETVDQLIGWLDSSANPVLVQLPKKEYARLADPWGLPRIE